jgi:hypothetical protein
MSAQPARHRFTADDYERMGAAGFFSEDDRVALIEGEILEGLTAPVTDILGLARSDRRSRPPVRSRPR